MEPKRSWSSLFDEEVDKEIELFLEEIAEVEDTNLPLKNEDFEIVDEIEEGQEGTNYQIFDLQEIKRQEFQGDVEQQNINEDEIVDESYCITPEKGQQEGFVYQEITIEEFKVEEEDQEALIMEEEDDLFQEEIAEDEVEDINLPLENEDFEIVDEIEEGKEGTNYQIFDLQEIKRQEFQGDVEQQNINEDEIFDESSCITPAKGQQEGLEYQEITIEEFKVEEEDQETLIMEEEDDLFQEEIAEDEEDPSSIVPASVSTGSSSIGSETDPEFLATDDESETELMPGSIAAWIVPDATGSQSPSPAEPEFEVEEPEFIITTAGSHSNEPPAKKRKQKHEPQPHIIDGKIYPKPGLSYSCLIEMSLKNSITGCLPVSEIYKFMCDHFPYFITGPKNWKSSVRSTLSTKKFKKIEKPGNGSCLWAL